MKPLQFAITASHCLAAPLLLLGVLVGGPARAQTPSAKTFYSHDLLFKIPFETDPGERRLQQIRLFVSSDQGKSWIPSGTVAPERHYFEFRAERDGLYWFALQTVDLEGRTYPMNLEGVAPGLKVYVDTKPPELTLRPATPREGGVGVEWEIRDDNLDLLSLRLDYHVPGAAEWQALDVKAGATGQHAWRPMTNGAIEVRLRVRDLADNWGEAKTTVNATGEGPLPGKLPDPPASPPSSPASPPSSPNVRMVNKKKFSLNYKIEDKGPSDVEAVELWYTPDGRNWMKYREDAPKPPFVVEVTDEGRYGFTLIARSGVGLSEARPQLGDQPQIWVEVDVTKPEVKVLGAEVNRAMDRHTLTIRWTASDKNLARQPITLSYAEQPDGPWTNIAKVENDGRYVWQIPAGVPYRFLLRVEATDLAGNVGSALAPNPVLVDLSRPKARILDVSPAEGSQP
jgi:hypothetical protein